MKKQLSVLFAGLLSLSLALGACGGAAQTPVTFGQLPTFTGAKESTNDLLVSLLNPMLAALRGDSSIKSVDGKAYDIPKGTGMEAIKSYYSTELGKSGWAAGPDSGAADVATYARGAQVLILKYGESVGLIVVLTEAK